jgi:hypothetical protein
LVTESLRSNASTLDDEPLPGLGTRYSIVKDATPGRPDRPSTFSLIIAHRWNEQSTENRHGAVLFQNEWQAFAKGHMITAITPILHDSLHHLMLFSNYETEKIECRQLKETDTHCTHVIKKEWSEQTLMSWLHGATPLVLPVNVGIRMDMSHFRVQYHLSRNDRRDEFGWRIVFRRKPEHWYNAYIVHLGLYDFRIPANTNATLISGLPPNCPSDYVVFAIMVHAHDWALWGALNVTRGGKSVFFYSHELRTSEGTPVAQQYRKLDVLFTFEPGDRCEVTCMYNTLGLHSDLFYGQKSDQEMCRLNLYGYENRELSRD